MENLKQIEEYPDYYVSDEGTVYSKKLGTLKKLKPIKDGKGYLYVNLCNKGTFKHIGVHRLVAQAFIPNPENKPFVNHLDGNKQNNNADNLKWVTNKENIQYFYDVQKPLGQYEITNEKLKESQKRYREKRKAQQKSQN